MADKPHPPKHARFSASAGSPPNYYMYYGPITGDATPNWISLPQAGNLWVGYAFQTQQVPVFIWHQGGQYTTVLPGTDNPPYPVGANDYITWALPTDGSTIKLGWQYV
jgi:hypothetical protein